MLWRLGLYLPLPLLMENYLRELLFSLLVTYRWRGDRAYEIPSLEVYLPILLAGLSVSLPQPNVLKRLNVLTLIATLGIGISLFIELTEGRSNRIPGRPHLSISDTQQDQANVGQTSHVYKSQI